MIFVFGIIITLYIFIISILYFAYQKVKLFKFVDEEPTSKFSIIIPFRNEAQNLEPLLNSIDSIIYPKELFEVILVDDDSEDNSINIIENHIRNNKVAEISIIKNQRHSNSPKKDAIQTAISNAKFEWIITTDADCIVPIAWLHTFDSFIKSKASKLIVAPVTYKVSKMILSNFQLHDFLSLQTATIGGFGIGHPFLCNGANLCYSKATFKELNGFEGNNSIASGDDLFFMEKVIENYPDDVGFLKTLDATVYTKPELSIKALFNQRVRWASKTSTYSNTFSKVLAFIVLLMNALLVSSFAFLLLGLMSFRVFILFISIKFIVDFFFILKSSTFFNQNSSLIFYPLNSLLYPLFVVSISLYSIFFKYTWKDRSFKK